METPMSENVTDSSKDEPLRDDIRLLGRVLGDTVREQEGEAHPCLIIYKLAFQTSNLRIKSRC